MHSGEKDLTILSKVEKKAALPCSTFLTLSEEIFLNSVHCELQNYIAVSQTTTEEKVVLLFPHVEPRLRFLIHQLVQENFENLRTFSIEQTDSRRLVVCQAAYLIQNPTPNTKMENKNELENTTPSRTARRSRPVQERQLYRPPPARVSESSPISEPAENQPKKTKRPDVQVYVPRARRSLEQTSSSVREAEKSLETNNHNSTTLDKTVQEAGKARRVGVVTARAPEISAEEEFNNRNWREVSQKQQEQSGAPPQVTRKISRVNSNSGSLQPKAVELGELLDSPDLAELTNNVQSCEILKSNAGEDSWEDFYDESGEPLQPDAMEELTLSVGKVKILDAFKDKYQDIDIRDDSVIDEDLSHVIEVYDFPSSFRTEDILTALNTPGKSSDFSIKWVDDTHALAVYSSAVAALDALSAPHSLAKVRPLAQASKESRHCARRASLSLQPYKPRPKTNASLARRLVSTALGIRNTQTPEQRKIEREILADAKAQKRLAAKQREAAWEGTF